MSCPHGNPISGCDTCDEVDAAFEAGKRSALAEQPASKPWVRLTDDDKCVKELYESDTDPEWIDGYTAGLKDAENKLRRYNAQPALVVEQLNPVAEGKCEICNDPSNLVIDHCHNSKDVRGILCWSCNVALGHFKDSEERLTSALKYLCKFKQNTQTL